MANYAGETLILKTYASDATDARTTITDDDVTSVTVTIVDTSDDSVVVNAASMSWDETDSEWRYVWSTPATAGSYLAKLHITGPSVDNWEYLKIKTKSNPDGF